MVTSDICTTGRLDARVLSNQALVGSYLDEVDGVDAREDWRERGRRTEAGWRVHYIQPESTSTSREAYGDMARESRRTTALLLTEQ